jgi:hypothetical protein
MRLANQRKCIAHKFSDSLYFKIHLIVHETFLEPLFTIGKAEGGGLLTIRHLLEKAAKKNPPKNMAT